jgi:hypothetical protein
MGKSTYRSPYKSKKGIKGYDTANSEHTPRPVMAGSSRLLFLFLQRGMTALFLLSFWRQR